MKNRIVVLFLFIIFVVSGCSTNAKGGVKTDLVIVPENNSVSKKWATYLYNHIANRIKGMNILYNEEEESKLTVYISVDENCDHDYCIIRTDKTISLTTRDERAMLWLEYQLISYLASENSNIDANDLPPSVISFATECRDFDFIYREPHFLPNMEYEYAPLIGTDMVETAWGLWGHGIEKIVKSEPDNAIYAREKGKVTKEQFCFSSLELYMLIKSYIIDNYGEKQNLKFTIMPNDNRIACDCERCIDAGNTFGNAAPALNIFVSKLAKSFPEHTFYTAAYLTTEMPPGESYPTNTGIIISTIDLPKGVALQPSGAVSKFVGLTNTWKAKTSNIYVWDYAANFDDWFTPLPVLLALQKQLKFFKEHNVNGVFLNGSGYDYSVFDDVKTHVAAALMMNVNADVADICRKYFVHFYPESGEHLADYYLSLEQKAMKINKPYQMYGSIEKSIIINDPQAFVEFYDSLESYIKKSTGEEKDKLIKLQTALSFSRLRLASALGSSTYGFGTKANNTIVPHPEIELYINRLRRYKNYEDMRNYKEADGLLEDYIKDIEEKFNHPAKNLLLGATINAITNPDEDYSNMNILTDGILGYSGDYHQGWMLVSKQSFRFEIKLNAAAQKNAVLKLRFLNDTKHNILPPSKVIISVDGKKYTEITSFKKEGSNLIESATNIKLSGVESLTIEMINQTGEGVKMAFDEIIIT